MMLSIYGQLLRSIQLFICCIVGLAVVIAFIIVYKVGTPHIYHTSSPSHQAFAVFLLRQAVISIEEVSLPQFDITELDFRKHLHIQCEAVLSEANHEAVALEMLATLSTWRRYRADSTFDHQPMILARMFFADSNGSVSRLDLLSNGEILLVPNVTTWCSLGRDYYLVKSQKHHSALDLLLK